MADLARKTVTVLFADVTGSTGMGERSDAETMREVLDRFFAGCSAILAAHGGTVEKYIGDAVVAVFGVPVIHEDDALRAVRAAHGIQDGMPALNAELDRDLGITISVRIGVNTGEVVAGGDDRSATFVTGDAANVAARLEQAAAPGEVLIGDSTWRLVRHAVESEPLPPARVRGRAAAVGCHRLVGLAPAGDTVVRLDPPLVDRDLERSQLLQAWHRVTSDRTGYLFTILGPPGIGKSRLVREFLASQPNTLVLQGRCLPYGEGITYWPLHEALRSLDDDVPAAVAGALAGEPDARTVTELVLGLVGLSAAAAEPLHAYWAVRRLVEALARDRPVALAFDDLQWAAPAFLDLVDSLAESIRDAPVLLLCMARPELLEVRRAWGGGKLNAASLLVGPLPEADAEALVGHLADSLRAGALAAADRERLLAAAEGNPLFIEQMMAALAESGLPPAELSQVPSVQALVGARLDGLEQAERVILERASVIGKEFFVEAVVEMCPEDTRQAVPAGLQALVRRDLIRPKRSVFTGGEAYEFRHLVVSDAAYAGISKAVRARLHEAFADWLEARMGARSDEIGEIVGYHLEQACRYRRRVGRGPADDLAPRAAARLAQAGRRAADRMDSAAASNLFGRAVALLPEDDPVWRELLVEQAAALAGAGDAAAALRRLGEAGSAAAAAGDRRIEARARLERATIAFTRSGDPGELLRVAREALPVLAAAGDEAGAAAAHVRIGVSHMVECRYAAAIEAFSAAGSGGHGLTASLAGNLAWALLMGPAPVADAVRRCRRLLGADPVEGTGLEAGVALPLAGLESLRGRADVARSLLDRAWRVLDDLGAVVSKAEYATLAGTIELWMGNAAEAERLLRRSRAGLDAIDAGYLLPECDARLAHALCELGRLGEAEAVLERAEAARRDQPDTAVLCGTARARLDSARGRHAEAVVQAERCADRAAETDSPLLRGDAEMVLAAVLAAADAPADAALAAARAEAAYREKGATILARRAAAAARATDGVSRAPRS